MAAKGEVKQQKTGDAVQIYTGLGVVEEIVSINPTNAQRAKLFGYELDEDREETEYLGKNEAGDDKISLDIYYRIAGIEAPRKHRFFLENCPIEFEDEDDDNKKKYVFVNQVGQLQKAETEDDLSPWFTQFQEWDNDKKEFVPIGEEKTFRKCLKGEDGLMRFLREALAINYELPSADLAYNYKKLFAGNVKELLSDLTGDLFRKFVVMTQVTVKDGENGESYFEKLWLPNNNFGVPSLPEESMKHIANGCKFPTGWMGKKWKKMKNGELSGGYLFSHTKYPPTGFAPLEPIRVYDSAEDVAAGKEAKKPLAKDRKAVVDDNSDY